MSATSAPLAVRVATPAEVAVVVGILREAAERARENGVDLWGSEFPGIAGEIQRGAVYLADIDGAAAGTFTLRWSDQRVWGRDDGDDGDAGYVHRLALRAPFTGQGLGPRLLDHAGRLVAVRGRRWLRLDCNRENAGLRRYYERLGFTHVRDVEGIPRSTQPGLRSASLYQRPAASSCS